MDRKAKLAQKKQKLKNEVEAFKNAQSGNVSSKFSVSQILQKAEEYVESFQLEMAFKFCEKAAAIEPNNLKAIELLGSLNLQLGKPVEAYENYTKAVELSPEVGHNKYMCLGQLTCGEEALNNYRKGIEIIKKQLSQHTDNTDQPKPVDLSNAYLAIAEMYLTDECFSENAENLCKENLDLAMAADGNNAEAYHLYASYFISKGDVQSAKESISKGIEMWLPKLREVSKSETQETSEWSYICPISYSGRTNCSKLLIELEEYETASEVLELLLDEDDQVVEVWYLLGWLNYLQGEEFRGNVKGYMEKGIELAAKISYEDEGMIEHMKEILQEVSQGMQCLQYCLKQKIFGFQLHSDADDVEMEADEADDIESSSDEEDTAMN